MTNFSELSRTWQHLHALAPEAFQPITDEEGLERTTRFLEVLDQELGEQPGHPLRGLADAVMHRIMAYEAEHHPVPGADGPMMLAFYLNQKDLTQQQVAAASGIGQSTISQLLNRKRPFTLKHAYALARVFGVDPSMFL